MKPGSVAVVGAAESEIGKVPGMSALELGVQSARMALADAGLDADDIDGVAGAGMQMANDVAFNLRLRPTWIDSTAVGGCSFFLHLRHAAAAITAGMAKTVVITHGESGRSRVGNGPVVFPASSAQGQFQAPYGAASFAAMFTVPALRFMHDMDVSHEQLAEVAVAQRQWAQRNPHAFRREPLTVEDVLASPFIAYPFHRPQCCLVTDGGGSLVVTSAERARDLPGTPAYVLGTGESSEHTVVSQMADFTSSRAFRDVGRQTFGSAGITTDDVDHLMIYDAFAHVPLYGLQDLGFVGRGEAGAFVQEGHTRPGGRLPMNTNGGGLSYTHTGMYGMFALQESIRQIRGTAPAQVDGVEVAFALGVGGMFQNAGAVAFGRSAL